MRRARSSGESLPAGNGPGFTAGARSVSRPGTAGRSGTGFRVCVLTEPRYPASSSFSDPPHAVWERTHGACNRLVGVAWRSADSPIRGRLHPDSDLPLSTGPARMVVHCGFAGQPAWQAERLRAGGRFPGLSCGRTALQWRGQDLVRTRESPKVLAHRRCGGGPGVADMRGCSSAGRSLQSIRPASGHECAGRSRRAGTVSMTDHRTGKSSVRQWKDRRSGADRDRGEFTRTALKRARPDQTGSSRTCSTTRNLSFSVGFIDGIGLTGSASA